MKYRKRVVKTITEIMENAKGDNVLVVSHGAACANFIKNFKEYNAAHYKKGIKNCISLYVRMKMESSLV